MCAKEKAWDSGKPKSAKPFSCSTIAAPVAASIPCLPIPSIRAGRSSSTRSTPRFAPRARRRRSACAGVKPAASAAIRMSCSWKRGTPRVLASAGSSRGCR